ncbi:hypothetical protein D3C76_1743930 [compost metagenome]
MLRVVQPNGEISIRQPSGALDELEQRELDTPVQGEYHYNTHDQKNADRHVEQISAARDRA